MIDVDGSGQKPLTNSWSFLQHDNKANNRKPPHMKFMITWQFRPGKLHDGLSQFSQMTPEQDQADHGSGVKLIRDLREPEQQRYLSNADVKGHSKPIFVENRAAAAASVSSLLTRC